MNESTGSVALTYARSFGDEECGASGILIADDWVVSHGSLLSARAAINRKLREFVTELEAGKMTSMPGDAEVDLELRIFRQESRFDSHSTLTKKNKNFLKNTLKNKTLLYV